MKLMGFAMCMPRLLRQGVRIQPAGFDMAPFDGSLAFAVARCHPALSCARLRLQTMGSPNFPAVDRFCARLALACGLPLFLSSWRGLGSTAVLIAAGAWGRDPRTRAACHAPCARSCAWGRGPRTRRRVCQEDSEGLSLPATSRLNHGVKRSSSAHFRLWA
jgi:hypothetical protein